MPLAKNRRGSRGAGAGGGGVLGDEDWRMGAWEDWRIGTGFCAELLLYLSKQNQE